MVSARDVLDEVAGQIAFFSAAAEAVGPLGIDLKSRAMAEAAASP
jgi:hypothetical protein